MSKIDDALIKRLVLEYQETGKGFSEIVHILSAYIYSYPRIHSNNEDACGEFYLYFFSRFKSSLQKYKPQKCLFLTWLTVVLYRQYLNWVKSNKKLSNSIVYLDEVLITSADGLNKNNNNNISSESNLGIISKILNSLPKKLRIVMKLHYFDFFKGTDLKEVATVFKQDELTLFSKYKDIANDVVEQHEERNKLIDKLNSIYHDITVNKEQLLKIEEEEVFPDRGLQRKLEVKLKKAREKQQKLLLEYQKFYITVKNDVISDFLGISLNAVHNLVYRGKRIIKDRL